MAYEKNTMMKLKVLRIRCYIYLFLYKEVVVKK